MATPQLPVYETEIIKKLDDLVTLDEAAKMLDKSGARVRQMIAANNFKRVWELGARPTYLLNRAEVRAMARVARRSARP